ncbi:Non-specific serine/threonine protein kinase protein [Dioscorea alata]|uniref:Non-specific serine/threonine protein kinase protein n=1 Tax=Dioscorea alata TaxID=55571 RepID=A0ACB7V7R7_DIOAL|nr:Non-specific serine/threonine protein kinase protein [Dioscorea alata]
MAGDAEIEEEMIEPQVQETHTDETIYVALGVNLKKDKPNLLWVLNNFPGCQVIILHVHRNSKWIPILGTKFLEYLVSENHLLQHRDQEKKRMKEILKEYMNICVKTGVQVRAHVIVEDDVLKGIQELVAIHQVKRLVLGSEYISNEAVLQCCQILLVRDGKHLSTSRPVLDEENHAQLSSSFDSDDDLQFVTPPNELEDEVLFDQGQAQLNSVDPDAVNSIEFLRINDQQKELQNAEEKFRQATEEKTHLKQQLKNLQKAKSIIGFTMQELRTSTKNFHNSQKIGEGGYGPVYKGILRKTPVAIKLLNSEGNQSRKEFDNEVMILSKVRHPNIVLLIGACSENSTLVYEYLSNGNLEDMLTCKNKTAALTWQTRVRIITEQRSALIFLHSIKPQCIVHGDTKLANIFLDGNNVSKLGDFGTARFMDGNATSGEHCTHFTMPMGTMGYMDPGFLMTGEISPACDVYSFGVVILRMVTGLRVLKIGEQVEEGLRMGVVREMMDWSAGEWPVVQTEQLVRLGLRCCCVDRESRPSLVSQEWRTLDILNAMAVQWLLFIIVSR